MGCETVMIQRREREKWRESFTIIRRLNSVQFVNIYLQTELEFVHLLSIETIFFQPAVFTNSTFNRLCKFIYKYQSQLFNFLSHFSPDVYIVTTTQALTWITDPKPLKQLGNFEAWNCLKKTTNVQPPCNISNKCALPFKTQTSNITETRYMETCQECPIQYPWLGDSEGTGISGRDNYIYNSNGEAAADNQSDQQDDEEESRKK